MPKKFCATGIAFCFVVSNCSEAESDGSANQRENQDIPVSVDAGNPTAPIPDEESKRGLGIPPMEPPVTRNTPETFKEGQAMLTQHEDFVPIDALRNRLFFQRRGMDGKKCFGIAPCALQPMDNRIAELNRRSLENTRRCTLDTPVGHLEDRLPKGAHFEYSVQCGEIISGPNHIHLSFGLRDGVAYIRETQPKNGVSGILGKINTATNDVEAWIIDTSIPGQGDVTNEGSENATKATVVHLKSWAKANVLEFVLAGNDNNSAEYGCGIHFRSNAKLMFVKGVGANGFAKDSTCDDTDNAYEVCYDAKSGRETDISACLDAGLDEFELENFGFIDIVESTLIEFNSDESIGETVRSFNAR